METFVFGTNDSAKLVLEKNPHLSTLYNCLTCFHYGTLFLIISGIIE